MNKEILETKVNYDHKEYFVYQDLNGEVLWAPIDFLIEEEKDKSTISTYRKAIRRLFKYINSREKGLTWLEVNDYHIEKFRDWCLEETKADSRYRGSENTAKQTVNHDYLMPIYGFYFWVQKQGKYHPNILGLNTEKKYSYQITSALLQKEMAISKNEKPNNALLYPKLFEDCDNKNRKQESADENDWNELTNHIISNYSGYERASLLLLVKIINDAGGRPISMSSLLRVQFTKEATSKIFFDNKKSTFDVVPAKAKQGNTMPIRFPFTTCCAIQTFIENDLNPFIEENNISSYDGHLFIDPKKFTPLTAPNITKKFSEITTGLGWPKGKSIYSFRHKFAGESWDNHIEVSIELGYSPDEVSTALQMQKEMTHKSSKSVQSYVDSRMRMGKDTEANKRKLKINELESDKTRLAIEAQKAFEIAEEQQNKNKEMAIELERLRKEIDILKNN